MKNTQSKRTLQCVLALSIATLVACGDNSSNGTNAPGSPSVANGRYTVQGSSASSVTVVEPSSTGGNEVTLWTIKSDASQLSKLSTVRVSTSTANGGTRTQGTVSGKVFTLGTNSVQTVSSGNFDSQAGGSQVGLNLQNISSENLNLVRSDALATELTLAQAQGTWQSDLGDVVVDWTLSGATISGSSTSGCSYSGTLSTVKSVSLYRLTFKETCGNTELSLSGIATLGTDGSRLSVASTTTDDTKAAVFFFMKSAL